MPNDVYKYGQRHAVTHKPRPENNVYEHGCKDEHRHANICTHTQSHRDTHRAWSVLCVSMPVNQAESAHFESSNGMLPPTIGCLATCGA